MMRWLAALLLCAAPLTAQRATLSKGLQHFYNLEYDEAIAAFREQIALQPEEPAAHNQLAMAILYRELYRSGALETELVSGGNPFLRRPKMNPSPESEKQFFSAIQRSMDLSQARLNKDPRDTHALYTLGVAHGLRANYNFLVRKAYMDSLRDATAARRLHNKVTDLDPSNVDARLVQGVHEYVVGSLPWHIRMLGFLVGFRGDKERGIQILEEVARKGRLNDVDAEVLLCAIYRRERSAAKAVPLLQDLIRRFPRNYLLRLELAQMYSDLGDKQQALGVLAEMERLRAEGAPGYARLPLEKILFARGVIQFWYNDLDEAIENLKRVTAKAEQLDLNTESFAWLRLGQAYDLTGRRELALDAYRMLQKRAPGSDAANQARAYLSSPYQRRPSS